MAKHLPTCSKVLKILSTCDCGAFEINTKWLETETPEARELRMKRHTHNGFSGSARWILTQADAIARSTTVTPEARQLALEILIRAQTLLVALKERIDHHE